MHERTDNPIVNVEHYRPIAEVETSRLSSVDELSEVLRWAALDPKATGQLATESQIFGLKPSADLSQFLLRHNALLDDMQDAITEYLPAVKESVAGRIAEYIGQGDPERTADVLATMRARLAATTQVKVDDRLVSGDDSHRFDGDSRQIVMDSAHLIELADAAANEEDFYAEAVGVYLTHEVMHAAMASDRITGPDGQATTVRNGLRIRQEQEGSHPESFQSDDYAGWLNEATIERSRQIILPTDTLGYEAQQVTLAMLDGLSPGLEKRMILAGLGETSLDQAYDEIRNLMGQTAIEDIEYFLEPAQRNIAGWEVAKLQLADMLPAERRRLAAEMLERAESAILGRIPGYYAARDEELAGLENIYGPNALEQFKSAQIAAMRADDV